MSPIRSDPVFVRTGNKWWGGSGGDDDDNDNDDDDGDDDVEDDINFNYGAKLFNKYGHEYLLGP